MSRINHEQKGSNEPETLAEMLVHCPDANTRHQYEDYRIKFEAVHGPTDLTKRYTSTWPVPHQNWLIEHDVKRYFDGLPPFVKAFLRGKIEIAASEGRLDDIPDNFLRLFIRREMTLDNEKPNRHR
jgi:hypothetical protein